MKEGKADILASDPDFVERMKEVVERAGSAEKLAKLSGISSRGIGKYLAGETDPSRARLIAIAGAAEVNLEWLATGQGQKTAAELDTAAIPAEVLARLKSPECAFIPLYDVRAAAGPGRVADSEEIVDLLVVNRTWLRGQVGADPAQLAYLYVEGDSMEPLLRPGEMILMDRGAANVPVDGVYVVRFDGHLMVKRIQREPGNVLTLSSVNPAYKPITLDPGDGRDLAVIGRVVWHGRNL